MSLHLAFDMCNLLLQHGVVDHCTFHDRLTTHTNAYTDAGQISLNSIFTDSKYFTVPRCSGSGFLL